MPFTPSHAVVALPFARTPLVPAAIAIGAMAPDLPLFVRIAPFSYQTTHTNLALSAGLALALCLVWWLLLRPAVRELAPEPIARRLPEEWDATGVAVWRAVRASRPGARSAVWHGPAAWIALLIVSALLGVASHIAWDAFTHEGRWGTRLFPALADTWGPLAGYTWVQHASSALGLVVLAVFGALWLSRRPTAPPTSRVLPRGVRVAWVAALPLLLVLAVAIGLAVYGPLTPEWTVRHLAYRVLPPACAVWGALTVALCAVIVFRRRQLGRAGRE